MKHELGLNIYKNKIFTMKTEKRAIGDFGENIAKKFLMKHDFSFVESNYLRPWGEIDLILRKGKTTHFIEVKSSVSYETVRPEENIHPKKLERMQRAVETYCLEHKIDEEDIQIDAIIVLINPDYKKTKIIYIDNVL